METATSTPEKQAKLLRLALDPAAPEGEAVAAFLKFKRAVLREGSSAVWFGGQAAAPAPPIPGFARCRVSFGKHRGETLGWLAENAPDYLCWLAGVAREPLRTRVKQTLRWADEGGRA